MAKQPKVIAFSPITTMAHVWIESPDNGFDGTAEPRYKLKLLIPKDTNDEVVVSSGGKEVPYMELLKDFCDALDVSVEDLDYTGLKDGDEIVNQKGACPEWAQGNWVLEPKSKFQPTVVDAAGKVCEEMPASGDVGRASFQFFYYKAGRKLGVSLQLRAVQIVEKRAGGDADFDAVEGEGVFVADENYEADFAA